MCLFTDIVAWVPGCNTPLPLYAPSEQDMKSAKIHYEAHETQWTKCPVRTKPGHEVCQTVQGTRLNATMPRPLDSDAAGVRLRFQKRKGRFQ